MGINRAGIQKNWAKCLFPNDGSGKTLRERDILLFVIAEIVRMFQAYDPDTFRFLSVGSVYNSKVIVVLINKKEKS